MAIRPLLWPDLDPDELLDYTINWTARLEGGETIVSVAWTHDPALTSSDPTNTTTHATVWLTGGVRNTQYEIVCNITTSAGRIKAQTVVLMVREK